MSSITEPPEVLGGLIGAALVGTFLGVLLAYGFVGPVGNNLKAYAEADTKYYECMVGFSRDRPTTATATSSS